MRSCGIVTEYNPFHNGHLQLALQAYRQFELSKVLVMPSGTPAHKSTKELIAAIPTRTKENPYYKLLEKV